MRVLVSTWGWRSHFYPLVPLAWALRSAGHDVRVASQPGMMEAITGAGLPGVPVGPALDFAEVFGNRVGRVATRAERAASQPAGIVPAVTADGGVVRYADAMLDELVAFGRQFAPDLMVFEPQNLAVPIAAAALGVPAVRQLWGPDETTQLDLDRESVLGPLAGRHSVPVADVRLAGDLTLDPCPPGMQVPLAGPSKPVRFVPYNGAAVLPRWLWNEPVRPRVCLTWGTMMASLGLDSGPAAGVDLAAVIAAVASLDVELVLALDPAQRERLGTLPATVVFPEQPLALQLLLPSCRAIISQGGAGTLMTALAAGVPQLVLPQVSDQHFNAERLVATGAGLSIPEADADSDTYSAVVRRLLAQLLGDGLQRSRAAELQASHQLLPAPAEVVPVLEELANTARSESMSGARS